MTKIEQRRKLLAEATPVRWTTDHSGRLFGGDYEHIIHRNQCHILKDAALIVAAVNDYAALLEIASALRELVDLRDGGHHPCNEVLYWRDAETALAKWESLP